MCSCSTAERSDSNETYSSIMSKLFGDDTQRGIEKERNAVVAWLRVLGMHDTANRIECGEHVEKKP